MENEIVDAARNLSALRKLKRLLSAANACDGVVADGPKAIRLSGDVVAPVEPQTLDSTTTCCICLDDDGLVMPCPEKWTDEGAWGYSRCCGRYFHFTCAAHWIAQTDTETEPYGGRDISRGHAKLSGGCPLRCVGAYHKEKNPDGVKWASTRVLSLGMRSCDCVADAVAC